MTSCRNIIIIPSPVSSPWSHTYIRHDTFNPSLGYLFREEPPPPPPTLRYPPQPFHTSQADYHLPPLPPSPSPSRNPTPSPITHGPLQYPSPRPGTPTPPTSIRLALHTSAPFPRSLCCVFARDLEGWFLLRWGFGGEVGWGVGRGVG